MSTKISPFQALYGRTPPTLIRYGNDNTTVDNLQQMLQERDAIIDDLIFNII